MIVAFDVDGTLIDENDKPRVDVIRKLIEHARAGDVVYVWSGGGVDYAKTWVHRLGLDDRVHSVIPKMMYPTKPDITYDDFVVALGQKNICVGSGEEEERW